MTRLVGGRELNNCRFNFQLTVKLRNFESIENLAFFTCEVRIIIASMSLGFCEAYWDNTPKTLAQNLGPNSEY